jgi:hypothetical protein
LYIKRYGFLTAKFIPVRSFTFIYIDYRRLLLEFKPGKRFETIQWARHAAGLGSGKRHLSAGSPHADSSVFATWFFRLIHADALLIAELSTVAGKNWLDQVDCLAGL